MNLVLIINLLEKSQLLRLISKIKGEGDEEERRRRNNKDVQVVYLQHFQEFINWSNCQVQTEPYQHLSGDELKRNRIEKGIIETSTEHDPLIDEMEVADDGMEAEVSAPNVLPPEISAGQFVKPQISSETISSDLEPPDNSDIVAATLEETPDDSNMTLDILDDTIDHQNPLETMEETGSTQLENISSLGSVEMKPNQDMVAVYLQNCSEYFKKFPHQLKACSRAQVDKFDTEDPTFPSGWKVKITLRGDTSLTMKQREIKEFLSPEFKIFRSEYFFPKHSWTYSFQVKSCSC